MPAEMTQDERARAIARLLIKGRERIRARLTAEAAEVVERGEASWLPWTRPPAPRPTEDDIRRRPRYRPFKEGASRSSTGDGSR